MKNRHRGIGRVYILIAALALVTGEAAAAGLAVKSLAAGIGYDYLSRTVVWSGDEADSKLTSNMLSARAEFGLAKGVIVGLTAGFSFSDVSGLVFDTLPISLLYDGPAIPGLVLGADVLIPIKKLGDFEMKAAGRIVYSSGMSETWPLEGFAVEGEAAGKPGWMEVALGPRLDYLFFGRVVPYVELTGRWLTARFRMSETLGELSGEETRKVGGDFAVGAALGADGEVSRRVLVKGKIGIMPFAGGVDTVATVGVLYRF